MMLNQLPSTPLSASGKGFEPVDPTRLRGSGGTAVSELAKTVEEMLIPCTQDSILNLPGEHAIWLIHLVWIYKYTDDIIVGIPGGFTPDKNYSGGYGDCPALTFYNDMGDPGFGYYTKAYTVSGTTVTLKNKGATEMIYGIMGTIA